MIGTLQPAGAASAGLRARLAQFHDTSVTDRAKAVRFWWWWVLQGFWLWVGGGSVRGPRVWGLRVRGCEACRVLGQPRVYLALPCLYISRLGRRPGGRELWGPAHWVSAGHSYRRARCPSAGLGGWTAGHKRRGRRLAPEGGAPGCRADSRRRGRLRPAGGPGSRCAPARCIIMSGLDRPGWRPEPTGRRPLLLLWPFA